MRDTIKAKFKTFKEEIGWWVGLISGILSIIEYKLDNIPTLVKIICFIACSLSLVLCIFKFFRFLTNTFAKYNEPLEELSADYHTKVEQLEKRYFRMSDGISKYLMSMNLAESPSFRDLCREVKDVFVALWPEYDISVSIKAFHPASTEGPIENWKIMTLGRSNEVVSDRCKYDKNEDLPTVSNNSDFKIILSPKYEDECFMCKDLSDPDFKQAFKEEYNEEYRNSTPRYWEKYASTIVVPIKKPEVDECLIIGFLCVDTKEPFKGSDLVFKSGANYLTGFAEMLYSFITNPTPERSTKI